MITGPSSGVSAARRTAVGLLAALIVLIVGLTVLSWFGRYGWLLDLLTFARQHLAVAGLALAALATVAQTRVWAAVALVAALLNGAALLPTGGSLQAAAAVAPGAPLRVLSLNVLTDNHRRKQVLRYLRESGADVIALEEVSDWWAEQVAGLADLYPFLATGRDTAANTVLILSRYPIVETSVLPLPPGTALDREVPVRAVIEMGLRRVAIYAVHPPTPRSLEQWRMRNAQLAWLAATSRRLDGDMPRVMLGDFNTPPWSFLFRDVTEQSGLRDAAGPGWRKPTRQPMLRPPHLAWAGAPVDHVLVSPDLAVARFLVGPYVFSDHFPVIADLLVPAAGPVRHGHSDSPPSTTSAWPVMKAERSETQNRIASAISSGLAKRRSGILSST